MVSAGGEADACPVCKVSLFTNHFSFPGSDIYHQSSHPLENGVCVYVCVCFAEVSCSLTARDDSEEEVFLLPQGPPLWVPRRKTPSSLMWGGRRRGKLPADSLFWQNHSGGRGNPLLFPKVMLFCSGW